ncbi:MAG: hypothetical protein ACP5N2_01825 [Candidatus Nanoarchaeia archaeon]
MNIINISFTGINANRQSLPKGGVSIANNVKLDSIVESNMGLSQARQSIKVLFTYKTDYNPNYATIELKGEVLILGSVEEVKKIMDKWSKEKKLDQESARTILNNIMNRCALEVILLSRELGLPSPIPLPSIKAEGAAKAALKTEVKAEKSGKKK